MWYTCVTCISLNPNGNLLKHIPWIPEVFHGTPKARCYGEQIGSGYISSTSIPPFASPYL